jgi:hypothetical protein
VSGEKAQRDLEVPRAGGGGSHFRSDRRIGNGLHKETEPIRKSELERERNCHLVSFPGMLELVARTDLEYASLEWAGCFCLQHLGAKANGCENDASDADDDR